MDILTILSLIGTTGLVIGAAFVFFEEGVRENSPLNILYSIILLVFWFYQLWRLFLVGPVDKPKE